MYITGHSTENQLLAYINNNNNNNNETNIKRTKRAIRPISRKREYKKVTSKRKSKYEVDKKCFYSKLIKLH